MALSVNEHLGASGGSNSGVRSVETSSGILIRPTISSRTRADAI
jgi:hypothetical protein